MSHIVSRIKNISTLKALRGEKLTIDLGITYDGVLTAWMKKHPNDPTYRSFDIVDNRVLVLSQEKTSDYREVAGGEITEAIAGKWYFDVEFLKTGDDPEDKQTIYTGTILFENDITGSNGVEVGSGGGQFPEYTLSEVDENGNISLLKNDVAVSTSLINVNTNKKTTYFGDDLFFLVNPISLEQIKDVINAQGFIVENKNESILEIDIRETGDLSIFKTRKKYIFARNKMLGSWGTGSDNGDIQESDLIEIGSKRLFELEFGALVIFVGEIGSTPINEFLNDLPDNTYTLVPGGNYYFSVTSNGEDQIYNYLGDTGISIGNENLLLVDFDLIQSIGDGEGIPYNGISIRNENDVEQFVVNDVLQVEGATFDPVNKKLIIPEGGGSIEGYRATGTASNDDLIIEIGDIDDEANGTKLTLDESGGSLDFNGSFSASDSLQGNEVRGNEFTIAGSSTTTITNPDVTSNNALNIPNKSGTIALLDDVVSATVQEVTTFNITPEFLMAERVPNNTLENGRIIYDQGRTIICSSFPWDTFYENAPLLAYYDEFSGLHPASIPVGNKGIGADRHPTLSLAKVGGRFIGFIEVDHLEDIDVYECDDDLTNWRLVTTITGNYARPNIIVNGSELVVYFQSGASGIDQSVLITSGGATNFTNIQPITNIGSVGKRIYFKVPFNGSVDSNGWYHLSVNLSENSTYSRGMVKTQNFINYFDLSGTEIFSTTTPATEAIIDGTIYLDSGGVDNQLVSNVVVNDDGTLLDFQWLGDSQLNVCTYNGVAWSFNEVDTAIDFGVLDPLLYTTGFNPIYWVYKKSVTEIYMLALTNKGQYNKPNLFLSTDEGLTWSLHKDLFKDVDANFDFACAPENSNIISDGKKFAIVGSESIYDGSSAMVGNIHLEEFNFGELLPVTPPVIPEINAVSELPNFKIIYDLNNATINANNELTALTDTSGLGNNATVLGLPKIAQKQQYLTDLMIKFLCLQVCFQIQNIRCILF